MFLRLFAGTALSGGLLLLACGDSPAGDDAGLADGPTVSHRLEWLTESPIELVFGESAEFRVRLLDEQNDPVAETSVHFALVGRADDASLTALATTTDSEGEATGNLTASTNATAFSLRVSAANAPSLFIPVGVSDLGFGDLEVTVTETDDRPITQVVVSVYANHTCESASTTATADRTGIVAEDEVLFEGLPAGIPYAVVASGTSSEGTELARGCVDEVPITANGITAKTIPLVSLVLIVDGRYQAHTEVDITPSIATLTTAIAAVLDIWPGSESEASIYLDALEQALRDAGQEATADAVADDRSMSTALEDDLAAELTLANGGIAVAFNELATSISDNVEVLELDGEMVILAMPLLTTAWESTSLQLRLLASEESITVPASAVNELEEGTVSASEVHSNDTVDLYELVVPIALGWLGQRVLDAVGLDDGASSTAEYATQWLGCTALDAWVDSEPIFGGNCDDSCTTAACDAVALSLAENLATAFDELDTTRNALLLSATLALTDTDADLRVDSFEGDSASAAWTAAGRTEFDTLSGSIEGDRISEPP